jgi:hypothetical protein
MLVIFLFLATLAFTGWVAFRDGGPSERQAVAAMASAFVLSLLLTNNMFVGPDVGILLVDAGLLSVFIMIAMRGDAFWPIWATGMQAGLLLVHAAAAVLPHLRPVTYVETMTIWSFAVLSAVTLGCLIERRELRR